MERSSLVKSAMAFSFFIAVVVGLIASVHAADLNCTPGGYPADKTSAMILKAARKTACNDNGKILQRYLQNGKIVLKNVAEETEFSKQYAEVVGARSGKKLDAVLKTVEGKK